MRVMLFLTSALAGYPPFLTTSMVAHLIQQNDIRVAVMASKQSRSAHTGVLRRATEMLTSGDWDIEGVLDCASPLICELIGKKYDTRKRRCKFSLGIFGKETYDILIRDCKVPPPVEEY
ncbi:MAG: hypothetical protein KVP17_005285 [Porospora cf. gigantea B]|uniref:uncharacterized protein n=1 Tax=Porospora cf. gigantea B TaxID=2853592 RepID=UPI00357198A7|nr:MAG: hypothetical protein KVP17_005285 [Porospora cf. gigantea B]